MGGVAREQHPPDPQPLGAALMDDVGRGGLDAIRLARRKPVESGFDRVAAEHVSPLVVYLASDRCRFTGRVFGMEGDDLFVFEGWSAEQHFNNDRRTWSAEDLDTVLAPLDRQDRGWMITPSLRVRGLSPTDETLAVLDELAAAGPG